MLLALRLGVFYLNRSIDPVNRDNNNSILLLHLVIHIFDADMGIAFVT